MTQLQVLDACVDFGSRRGVTHAVDDVSFDVPEGTVTGLVGGSGSGKSTLARAIVGMQPLTSGRILLDGRSVADIGRMNRIERARQVQMIFQDPHSSLNPRMRVEECIDEVLRAHSPKSRQERSRSVSELLEMVRLKPDQVRRKYPKQLSGGMRQRIAIARCLAVRPRFMVADEITSALDASVQGAVINVVRQLQKELNLSMLFISHNLAVVRYIADNTLIMHAGRIVERGASDAWLHHPEQPYTRELVDAIPTLADAGKDVLLAER